MAIPASLDEPESRASFSTAAMRRRLRVLFLVSESTWSPAFAVHATLMRFLNRERVEIHVAYNRRAAAVDDRSARSSVLSTLPQDPSIPLTPLELGPTPGESQEHIIVASARAIPSAVRDAAVLTRYIRRRRIDVIHCEEGIRSAFYSHILSRLTPAVSVVHFHLAYGDWMPALSRAGVRRADAIIAVSRWTGRGIMDAGVPGERIFPVLNGIDVSGLDPERIDGSSVRRELGIGPDAPLIACVAQLVEWKRQHLLLEAFAAVAARRPDARLLLVGSEWAASGHYTRRLRELAAQPALAPRVIFVPHRDDIPRVLAAADVFALPSVGEPFGLVFAEAMAMATPVVAVNVGGPAELIEDGRTGLLGPPDDTGWLAESLLSLIEDPVRRAVLGSNGRRHALERLNAQRMADEIEAVYRQACRLSRA